MDRFAIDVVEQSGGGDSIVVDVEVLEHQKRAHAFNAAVDAPGPVGGAARLVDEEISSSCVNIVGDEFEAREERAALRVQIGPEALDRGAVSALALTAAVSGSGIWIVM